MATKWTWDKLHKEQSKMTDKELDKAIGSFMPDNIRQITRKIDRGADLSETEEKALEQWESSPQSGVAGSIMGGK